jgi:hypothetical protein
MAQDGPQPRPQPPDPERPEKKQEKKSSSVPKNTAHTQRGGDEHTIAVIIAMSTLLLMFVVF